VRHIRAVLIAAVVLCILPCRVLRGGEDQTGAEAIFTWMSLPPLPGPLGRHVQGRIEGAYVGTHNGALIVAGGAPAGSTGSLGGAGERLEEVWRDIYVLALDAKGEAARGPDGEPTGDAKYRWHTGFRLPRGLAYGAVASTKRGTVCIGGRDAEACRADVLLLTWDQEARKIDIERLPSLPEPRAYAAAAAVGSKVYLAGGLQDPADPTAKSTLWVLDLAPARKGAAVAWDRRPSDFPGEGRVLPALVAQDSGAGVLLYLIGGRGAGRRGGTFTEAFVFDPAKDAAGRRAWRPIAESPAVLEAAPLVACGQAHILAFGRVGPTTGGMAQAYHTITNTWTPMPVAPPDAGPAVWASSAVKWKDSYVVLGASGPTGPGGMKLWKLDLKPRSRRFGAWNWAALAAYLLALVGMGMYFSRRGKTTDDYFLAGGRIPWWAAGLSIFGTALSAITFMSFPATAYATNWVWSLCTLVPILIVPLVIAFYIPFYRRLRITTAYEYLERRFNLPTRLVGTVTFILFQLGRMTFILFLPALALATVTGINVYLCIALMGLLCTVYTVLGGIEAVIWTDVLQVVILIGAAVLSLVLVAVSVEGGAARALANAAAAGKLHAVNLSWDIAAASLWVVVVGTLFSSLLPFTADQTVVQRYLATRDEKSAGRALWMSALGGIPIVILFYGLGTALWAFYRADPGSLSPAVRSDAIFPLFIVQRMPPGVCGLVIAGIFAAGMSSVDSSMSSVATAAVTDFYRRFKPGAPDRVCLRLARAITVVLGLVAVGTASVFAATGARQVLKVYMEMFGLVGGGLSGLFALGIFTRRANGTGVLIGAGASAVVLACVKLLTDVHLLLYPAIGVVVCFSVGYAASLIFPGAKSAGPGLTLYTLDKLKSR